MSRNPRPHLQLSYALGSVEYEMMLLAVALREYVNLGVHPTPGRRELLSETVLTKARTLLEFIAPVRKSHDQIRARDFGIAMSSESWGRWYGRLSNLTVHLSWDRATPKLPSGAGAEGFAVRVLRESADVCSQIRESGIRLVDGRHTRRHALVRQCLRDLKIDYPRPKVAG